MDIYLHHYPASLFSEKVRLLLGYLGLTWNSVVIPSIMPRPLLMPLSGGYRRTPVLQIGANVYCDTKIISRALARHCGNGELYSHGFTAHRVADWADTQLFQVTVALNFSPKAVAAMMGGFPPEEAAAFQKDRAQLTQGASITSFSADAATAYLRHYLEEFNGGLGEGFLFGSRPSIADFSVYHCLWFVNNNRTNAPLLDAYGNVRVWMDEMAAFGHGRVEDSTGEAALAAAKAATPQLPAIVNDLPGGFSLGQEVDVAPVDYGKIPVRGRLAAWSAEEVVIEREAPETGLVMVHFPAPGFEVRQA
ncbi:MAG: glutathione S-transferase family protein [Pseudomonadales bacterium]